MVCSIDSEREERIRFEQASNRSLTDQLCLSSAQTCPAVSCDVALATHGPAGAMDCDGDELGVFFSGAVRQNPKPRSGCGGVGHRNALEQRTDRGPDQPTQSYQASDVWACWLRASESSSAALVGLTLSGRRRNPGFASNVVSLTSDQIAIAPDDGLLASYSDLEVRCRQTF
jgi:hypothetical protein